MSIRPLIAFVSLGLVIAVAVFLLEEKNDRSLPAIEALQAPGAEAAALPLARADAAVERSTNEDGEVEATAAPAATGATIVGRFVNAEGASIANVTVGCTPFRKSADPAYREPMKALRASSGEDGRFLIALPPENDLNAALYLEDPRWIRQTWRREELGRDAREDLGDIVLHVGATVRGRLINLRGEPITSDWRVEAYLQREDGEPDRSSGRDVTAPPAGSAEFEIGGCAPGTWELMARFEYAIFARTTVTLSAGETLDVVFEQDDGRDYWSELELQTVAGYLHPQVERSHIRLLFADGSSKNPEPSERNSSTFLFRDLTPGPHVLEIDDPAYEPWRREDVVPGPKQLQVQLKGRSQVTLICREAQSGAALEELVWTRFRHASPGRPESGKGSESFEEPYKHYPNGQIVIKHEVHGNMQYLVKAKGYAKQKVRIENLLPNEAREVQVSLHKTLNLSGRVVDQATATPVAGARVSLIAPAEVGDSDSSPFLSLQSGTDDASRMRREIQHKKADENGSFRFDVPGVGEWLVLAQAPSDQPRLDHSFLEFPHGPLQRVDMREGHDVSDVVLQMPTPASIRGVLKLPEGHVLPPCSVELRPISDQKPAKLGLFTHRNVRVDDKRGFRFDGLAAGRYSLWLAFSAADESESAMQRRPARFLTNCSFVMLEELELTSGERAERSYDALPLLPATLEVLVEIMGGATKDAEVVCSRDPSDRQEILVLKSDREGRFRTSALSSAPWRIELRSATGEWAALIHEAFTPLSNTNNQLSARVELVSATLRLRSSDNQALASMNLTIDPVEESKQSTFRTIVKRRTDAAGAIELALPRGSYQFSVQLEQDKQPIRLRATSAWPPAPDSFLVLTPN